MGPEPRLSAATSPNNLYSSKQFGIGGRGSVRGIDTTVSSGRTGAYFQNDLSYTQTFPGESGAAVLRMYSGLDYGVIERQWPNLGGEASGIFMGGIMSVIRGHTRFDLEFETGRALELPEGMSQSHPAGYIGASVNFLLY